MVHPAFTALTGMLALSQLGYAAPQRNIGASDSETCIAGDKMYHSGHTYDNNNAKYMVRCAKDSGGNVQSVQKVSRGGFASCFDACERTKDCAGFTYSGDKDSGNCYLKSKIGSYSTSSDDVVSCHKDPNGKGEKPEPVYSRSTTSKAPVPATSSSTTSKAPVPTTSASTTSTSAKSSVVSTSTWISIPSSVSQCQQAVEKYGTVYRGGSGSAYQLSCGTDHYGGDHDNEGSASFLGCVDVCDKKPDCIGYAYTPGICYLKSYLKDAQVNPAVDFAINLEGNATAKPPVTTSSSTTTSPTGTPTPQPGSCGYLAANGTSTYYNTDGTRYTIECGTDHNGGDLISLSGKNFADCSVFCDKTDLCIAFAWVGGNGPGTCYLKSKITTSEVNVDVDYAYRDASTYLPSSSAGKPWSTSSTVSVPVKPSSSSTGTLPPPTWTGRPTWTESRPWSSTSSSVSSPVKPSSSSTSSTWTRPTSKSESSSSTSSTWTRPTSKTESSSSTSSTWTRPTSKTESSSSTISTWTRPTSKTESSGTTLTLTHTYTRPSYSETTTSRRSKTRHTKSSTTTYHSQDTKTWKYTRTYTTPQTYSSWSWTTPTASHTSHTKSKSKGPKTKSKETSKTHRHTRIKPTYIPSTSVTKSPSTSTSSIKSTSTSTYTQVNWVSSTAASSFSTSTSSKSWVKPTKPAGPPRPNKPDEPPKPHKPDEPPRPNKPAPESSGDYYSSKTRIAKPSKIRHNPVRTTKTPFEDQKYIDDHDFCGQIRGSKYRYLQAKSFDGNPKFDGLWVEDPYNYNGYKAQLCSSKENAAPVVLNREAKVLTTWRDRVGCAFIGLRMYVGDLTEEKQDTWLGEASFGNGTDLQATGHMAINPDNNEFYWDHEYFDHWLVCDHFEGVPVLKYRDNYHHFDYDMRRCGRVKLFWTE
ncbi:hypothetical protein Q7P37_005033 [Cladosporium fusiforme]